MATVTNAFVPTPSTANASSYVSDAFTPVVGDLLVALVDASDTAAAGSMTSSANGITWTRILTAVKGASGDTQYVFVANQLVGAAPSSMTVTFSCAGDAATGAIISVARIAGCTKVGTAAVRQSAKTENLTGGTAPSFTFASSALTHNVILFGYMHTTAAGVTPASGMTERVDVGYSTPTTGGGYDSQDSGFTGTTKTLGTATVGNCCGIGIEIDTSSPVTPKTIATTWNVRGAVTPKTILTTWNVRGAVTPKEIATSFNVRGAVSPKTTLTTWAVRSSVAPRTIATTYNVRQAVAKTVLTTWSVRATVTKTVATTYNVRATVTKTVATTWDVLETTSTPVTPLEVSTTWRVRQQVVKTVSTTYNVRAAVTKTTATSYNVRSSVAPRTTLTTWAVRSAVAPLTVATSYAVRQAVAPRTVATSWNVDGFIVLTVGTSWNVRERAVAEVDTAWAVRSSVAPRTVSTSWPVRAAVAPRQIDTTWNVRVTPYVPARRPGGSLRSNQASASMRLVQAGATLRSPTAEAELS